METMESTWSCAEAKGESVVGWVGPRSLVTRIDGAAAPSYGYCVTLAQRLEMLEMSVPPGHDIAAGSFGIQAQTQH